MIINRVFEIRLGYSYMFGVNYDGEGVNFVIFFVYVECVEFCFYDLSGEYEIVCLELLEYIDEIWYGYVLKLQFGVLYGYCVYGFYDLENGYCFNFNKLFIDFYVCELVGDIQWDDVYFVY